MKIQLSPIFQIPGQSNSFVVRLDSAEIDGYRVAGDSDTNLILTPHDANQLSVSGDGQIELLIPCSRCLTDVKTTVPYEFEYKVNRQTLLDEDNEPAPFLDGDFLDAEVLVTNEIRLNLPMSVLCKPDCKGFCPVCGTNLNDSTCTCNRPKAPTRFAEALQKALNERKD